MKHVQYFTKGLLMAGFCLALGACSNDDLLELEQDKTQDESTTHTIAMEFIGDVVGFDQQSNVAKVQTRATSSSWTNGDKIYITFYNGSNIVPGEATYSSSSGWSVSYDGNLGTGSNLKCEARYFVNATFSSSSLVTLNPNTEIYEDLNGSYSYSAGSLTVQASLTPKTGRIRFTGTSGAKIHLTGITTYTTFAPDVNNFSTSEAMIHQTVASSGSTPYIYGFVSTNERNISIVGNDFAYYRSLTSDMFKTGESGYMAIPTESSHNNWRSGLYVKVNGIEMKMVPVAGLSSGFFLIGETEVTEGLYNSVMGTTSTSTLPIDNISYSSIRTFIEKLKFSTNLSFDLPTTEQWSYAAKGGNKTQNYNYSGSNTPGDVAWYKGNALTRQSVKTKTPNELGIYDMSGNVGEFVKTLYNSWYPYILGGAYLSPSEHITTDYSCHTYNLYYTGRPTYDWNMSSEPTTTSSYCKAPGIGFRLILTCE